MSMVLIVLQFAFYILAILALIKYLRSNRS